MAVDRSPQPGRILLGKAEPNAFYPWFTKVGKIEKVVGDKIYCTDEEGNSVVVNGFSFVVDTAEEEAVLLKFTEDSKKIARALTASLNDHMAIMMRKLGFSPIEAKDETPKPQTRVRRPVSSTKG